MLCRYNLMESEVFLNDEGWKYAQKNVHRALISVQGNGAGCYVRDTGFQKKVPMSCPKIPGRHVP